MGRQASCCWCYWAGQQHAPSGGGTGTAGHQRYGDKASTGGRHVAIWSGCMHVRHCVCLSVCRITSDRPNTEQHTNVVAQFLIESHCCCCLLQASSPAVSCCQEPAATSTTTQTPHSLRQSRQELRGSWGPLWQHTGALWWQHQLQRYAPCRPCVSC